MKNLNFIICLGIALICVAGCSKKSNPEPENKISIAGKWTEDSLKVEFTTTGTVTSYHQESTPDGTYMQFDANAAGSVYFPAALIYPATTIQITYSVTGTSLSLNYPAYSYGGVSHDVRTEVWAILTLNEHKLAILNSSTDSNGVTGTVQHLYYSR